MTHPIPRFGFGTWNRNGDEAYRTVQDALAIGYRHIDTAEGRAATFSSPPRWRRRILAPGKSCRM
jgi:hypothetical protein